MAKNTNYNGNTNLVKEGVHINWTPQMVAEFKKCKDDPVYFIETYGKIISVDDGLVPFILYPYQREIVSEYPTNPNICLNQSRQSGKTSVITAIILHFAIFNKQKRIAILANKEEQAIEILERIQITFENLPMWLKGGVKEWNKKTVVLENGTKIVATASSSSAIRGKSQSMLYIDELAFVPHWDQFSASVLPTLSSGKKSRLIFTSTPNGLNHFYEYCEGAKNLTNNFWYKEVPWYDVPGRDEAWKEKTLKEINYDMEKFEAEYCCSFIGSSGTLISGWKLKIMKPEHPIWASREGLYKFEEPFGQNRYVVVCDVSRGKGLDYSAFSVIDVSTPKYRQVCTFRSNQILPYDYANVIYRIAKTYNHAYVLVEVNDIGEAVSQTLYHDFEYDSILMTESNGRSGKRISGGFSARGIDMGIRTTKTVKNIGCSMLKMLVETDRLKINDKFTLDELNRFSKKGQSWEAEEGAHDDMVMGLVLFGWLVDQNFFKEETEMNILKEMREHEDDTLVPFFVNNGLDELDEESRKFWQHESETKKEPREDDWMNMI